MSITFICPLCSSPLEKVGGSLKCSGGKHTYDVASSGYVNLLPPGKKSNASTGDEPLMIGSRRDFLAAGYYDRISDTAAEVAAEYAKTRENPSPITSFADAGCGEGYHTLRIFNKLKEFYPGISAVGFDASKKGADSGAKKAKRQSADISFAAANIFAMPIRDRSVDAVFSMFAPVPAEDSERILKDGGLLVVVSSGSRHLWQMREVLYGEPRLSPPYDKVPKGFSPVLSRSLLYTVTLSGNDIKNLFTMTPFYYRSPKEGKEKLLSLQTLTTEISVEYKVYEKS